MRTVQEIEVVLDKLKELDGPPAKDSFENGMLLGKMTALEWVLGAPGSTIGVQHDFISYGQELLREADDVIEEAKRRLARAKEEERKRDDQSTS